MLGNREGLSNSSRKQVDRSQSVVVSHYSNSKKLQRDTDEDLEL